MHAKMFYAYEISYAKSHERAVKTIIKINDLKVYKLRINLLVLNYYSSPHCGFLTFKPKAFNIYLSIYAFL